MDRRFLIHVGGRFGGVRSWSISILIHFSSSCSWLKRFSNGIRDIFQSAFFNRYWHFVGGFQLEFKGRSVIPSHFQNFLQNIRREPMSRHFGLYRIWYEHDIYAGSLGKLGFTP